MNCTAICYGVARHYLRNPANLNTRTFVGSRDFGLVQEGAVWRIDRFKFNVKFIEGNPNLEGLA